MFFKSLFIGEHFEYVYVHAGPWRGGGQNIPGAQDVMPVSVWSEAPSGWNKSVTTARQQRRAEGHFWL